MNREPDSNSNSLDLIALGDRAWLARFEADDRAAAWAEAVRRQGWPGVVDVVAAYRSAAVFADPDCIDMDDLESRLRAVGVPEGVATVGRLLRVPVRYDGEDLAEVARRLGMAVEEIIARHSDAEYTVRAIGFLPGFPYLGDLSDALAGLPRREPPRLRVPAGSVAIAGRQSCIYPVESPGGWHLLGRTPLVIAEAARDHFPMRAGDRVRFEPIDATRFATLAGRHIEPEPGEIGGSGPVGS